MSEALEPGSDSAAPAAGVPIPTDAGQASGAADQNAGSATADDHGATTEGASDTEAQQPPRGVGKRISELLTERAYERQRAEAAERALRDALLQRNGQQDNVRQPPPAELPPEIQRQLGAPPDPSKFPAGEFDPAYAEERAFYRLKQEQARAFVAHRTAQAQQQQQQSQHQLATRVAQFLDEGSSNPDFPDFDEVVRSDSLAMPPHVVRELADLDKPAAVAYWLGKNPAEAKRIAGLGPTGVARELGRIEARLSVPPTPAPQLTAAPEPPPRAVRGSGGNRIDPDKLSVEQWADLRAKGWKPS